ncbi:MAG: hypothetical protein PG981_000086 [Wolbachia endosymbiont of Ctenocephalides orientis wCori]|nr:MAG: hypothetical protein PG981_000086 [Wolbachia endosymbiont of Ctenocephalides orientis wCori]
MGNNNLTETQKELYDALNNNNGTYPSCIDKATKDALKAILNCKFNNDLPLLAFIHSIPLLNHLHRKLEKISQEHPDDNEMKDLLGKFFAPFFEVKINNQEKVEIFPLDYAVMKDYDFASLLVIYAKEHNIDLECLTIQKIGQVDGKIDVKKFIELVEKKMKEAVLPIAQHTPHSTQNEQQSLIQILLLLKQELVLLKLMKKMRTNRHQVVNNHQLSKRSCRLRLHKINKIMII